MTDLSNKALSVYNKVYPFFIKNPQNLKILLHLIQKKNKKSKRISLRLLDWFVITYAKQNQDLRIPIEDSNDLIYQEYYNELNTYSKKLFDPFCRHTRIYFHYYVREKGNIKKKQSIETTIAQLNFVKWSIEKRIFHYIFFHRKRLQKLMNDYDKAKKFNNKKLQNKLLNNKKKSQNNLSNEKNK